MDHRVEPVARLRQFSGRLCLMTAPRFGCTTNSTVLAQQHRLRFLQQPWRSHIGLLQLVFENLRPWHLYIHLWIEPVWSDCRIPEPAIAPAWLVLVLTPTVQHFGHPL